MSYAEEMERMWRRQKGDAPMTDDFKRIVRETRETEKRIADVHEKMWKPSPWLPKVVG